MVVRYIFIRFDKTYEYDEYTDRQTDRQTDGHRPMSSTALTQCSRMMRKRTTNRPFEKRVVDVVGAKSGDVLQRSRLAQSELYDRHHVDETARVRQRLQAEVPARLGRTPLARSAVRQRMHPSGQLVAHDAELARAFQPERSHLIVRVVDHFVRLIHLNKIPLKFVERWFAFASMEQPSVIS